MFAEFGYLTLLLSVTFEVWLSVYFMKVGGRREKKKISDLLPISWVCWQNLKGLSCMTNALLCFELTFTARTQCGWGLSHSWGKEGCRTCFIERMNHLGGGVASQEAISKVSVALCSLKWHNMSWNKSMCCCKPASCIYIIIKLNTRVL